MSLDALRDKHAPLDDRMEALHSTEYEEMDEAPQGYKDFDHGAAKKYVIDPHRSLAA